MRQNFKEPNRNIHTAEEYERHSNQKAYVEMLSGMREVR